MGERSPLGRVTLRLLDREQLTGQVIRWTRHAACTTNKVIKSQPVDIPTKQLGRQDQGPVPGLVLSKRKCTIEGLEQIFSFFFFGSTSW